MYPKYVRGTYLRIGRIGHGVMMQLTILKSSNKEISGITSRLRLSI